MNRATFMLIVTLATFSLALIPVQTLEIAGKRLAGLPKQSGTKAPAMKAPRNPESLRSSFLEAVAALRQGHPLIASVLLSGLDKEYPVLSDYIQYYQMRAALEMKDPSLALYLTDRLIQDHPASVLIPRVRVEMVRAYLELGQSAAAVRAAQGFLEQEEDSARKRELSLLLGRAHEQEGEWKQALQIYEDLTVKAPLSPESKEAGQRITRIAEETGSRPEPPSDRLFLARVEALSRALRYEDVIRVCEDFEKAYPASDSLDSALLEKAKALLKNGEVDRGIKLYEKLIQSGRTHGTKAEAGYGLARHYWNRAEHSRAKREFKRLIKRYPKGEWELKARYALGRIYESEKDLSEAREQYLGVLKLNPGHSLAPESSWRVGWVEYGAGKYKKAGAGFASCMKRFPNSDIYPDALYWKGRSEEKSRNVEEAQRVFQRLAKDFSWSFYGVMARKRLESTWNLMASEPELSEQMNATWDPEPIRAEPGSPQDHHLGRAEELIRIGFREEAKEEIDALRRSIPDRSQDFCYIGMLYQKSQAFYDSIRWMYSRQASACGSKAGPESPMYNRFLYPLAFWDTVQKETGKQELDPYLVLAVMRQESLFQVDVVSFAGARGLMQIIPSTGKSIAQRLGVNTFSVETLFDPEVNIAFGTWYLRSLMDRSSGDLVRVLSSYNAGESRSDQWWERFKHLDIDERIESITFRETRGYVKKVLRNLENYKRIYEHSPLAQGEEASR